MYVHKWHVYIIRSIFCFWHQLSHSECSLHDIVHYSIIFQLKVYLSLAKLFSQILCLLHRNKKCLHSLRDYHAIWFISDQWNCNSKWCLFNKFCLVCISQQTLFLSTFSFGYSDIWGSSLDIFGTIKRWK